VRGKRGGGGHLEGEASEGRQKKHQKKKKKTKKEKQQNNPPKKKKKNTTLRLLAYFHIEKKGIEGMPNKGALLFHDFATLGEKGPVSLGSAPWNRKKPGRVRKQRRISILLLQVRLEREKRSMKDFFPGVRKAETEESKKHRRGEQPGKDKKKETCRGTPVSR